MKKALFTGIVILSMLVTNLKAQWVQVNAIYYGMVQCFATMPYNSGGTWVFAGTYRDGVFVSKDNGSTWTAASKGLNNNDVNALFASGTNLFAGTAGGVFLSTDYGANWTSVSTGLTTLNVYGFAMSGNNLFAATGGGGVFLSTNNGTSWTAVNNGLTDLYVNFLATASNGSGGINLYAGTHYGGAFLSTNNGTSWTQVNNGLPVTGTYVSVSTFVSTPNGTGNPNLFVGTGNGVYLSTNNGTSWTESGLTGQSVMALTVSGTNLIAGCYNGEVYLSTDNGTSWNPAGNGIGAYPLWSLTSVPNGGGFNLIAGTSNGIFVSANNGTNWTMNNSGISNLYVRSLTAAPDGTGGTNLFFGTGGNGIFVFNRSDTLIPLDNGFSTPNFNIMSMGSLIKSDSTYLFAGVAEGRVYRSADNGLSWTWNTADGSASYVKAFAASGTNLFAGTGGGGVFLSANNGKDWTEMSTGMTNKRVNSLLVDGTDLFAGTEAGVFLSTDNGTGWTEVSTGLTNTWINSLAANTTNIFAGGWGVFRSSDNGSNWTKTNAGFSPYIQSLYVSGANLFAGTNGGGAFLSTNEGTTWTAVNTGLPDGLSGLCFTSRKNSSNATILYMGTEAGIWTRPLSDITGIDDHRSSSNEMLDLQQNCPNPFNATTTIKYTVTEPGYVSITVVDVLGTEVASLVKERKAKGDYSIDWNASGLAGGIYFCMLQNGKIIESKKMQLIK